MFSKPIDTHSGTATAAKRDYAPEARIIFAADFGSQIDVLFRYGALSILAALMSFAFPETAFLPWLLSYVISNVTYFTVLRNATKKFVSRIHYFALLAVAATSSTIYFLMPLYLLTMQVEPVLKIVGAVALIGYAAHNLSRHVARTPILYFDTAMIVGMMMGIAVVEASYAETTLTAATLVASLMTVSLYYVIAQSRTIASREEAARSLERALVAEKMQAMGRVTAGVAHDFNNILTVVQGNIELAQLADNRNEKKKFLEEAYSSAGRATSLVSHMMAFVGKSPLFVQSLLLTRFFENLQPQLDELVPENIDIQIVPVKKELRVEADATLLETALINLVTNARDAIGEASGHIRIRAFASDGTGWAGQKLAEGAYVAFEVKDTGPGIAPTLTESVLEPFFTTKTPGNNSGLGLSMVKGFAEQLGGGLALFNHPTGGLVVQFILPLQAANTDAPLAEVADTWP